jgi:hypothetical protein
MNYQSVYTTLKAKLKALVPDAAVRLPNERPAEKTALDIDVSVTETDSTIYTEVSTKHNVSIDLLVSVPASTGTEAINNIVSKIVTAFDPLQDGNFWTDHKEHCVRMYSVSQKQPNISDNCYRINVRILAVIYQERS